MFAKTIAAASTVVVALSALTMAAIFALNSFGHETIDRSGPTMLERIRTLEEFTAAEGSFSQVIDLEEETKVLGKTIPAFVTGEHVTAFLTGSVRATVDFSSLDEGSVKVDEESSTIRITLPEPALSDADIDEKSVRIFRERGLVERAEDFFASNPTNDSPVYVRAEAMVSGAAAESDLLDRAGANTEQWLRTFLAAAGFEDVIINWQQSSSAGQTPTS